MHFFGVLVQVHIAQEETKHGLDLEEAHALVKGWDPVRWSAIELRGLMVMRYRLEKTMSQSHGVSTAREVLDTCEATLAHEGFRPGQDGLPV